MKKQKKSEEKDLKIIKKWTKILKDLNTVDEAVFKLKKMVFQYSGNVAMDFASNKLDENDEQVMYNTFLENRIKITKLLTKEY